MLRVGKVELQLNPFVNLKFLQYHLNHSDLQQELEFSELRALQRVVIVGSDDNRLVIKRLNSDLQVSKILFLTMVSSNIPFMQASEVRKIELQSTTIRLSDCDVGALGSKTI